ncbi:adrenodoxin, mitochondrial [Carlito syrichta]|uniref:Adrenal ferredoxin n=1 Tax=Carlito syrichta TaxID=1868482 RepID=A0A1U7T3U7_CARSF|nr:adrenodoxin, mitochondrial [Carlito syrichta]
MLSPRMDTPARRFFSDSSSGYGRRPVPSSWPGSARVACTHSVPRAARYVLLAGKEFKAPALECTAFFSSSEDKVTVHFINRDGETLTAQGKVGDSLLDVVVENHLDIDGFGACEGTLACSTCHLIFEEHVFEKLDPITDEENDMLDLAYGLTDRSRLGCQICLTKSMDNMTVRVPETVADARQSLDIGKTS